MKTLKQNRFIFLIYLVFCCVFCCILICLLGRKTKCYASNNTAPSLSALQVKEDRDEVIDFVEKSHPYFVDGNAPKPYKKAKEKYIRSTSSGMKTIDFKIETAKFLAFFKDCHTHIALNIGSKYLNLPHMFLEGKLYYVNKKNKIKEQVISIDNINIEDIVKTIDEIFPYENKRTQHK